MNNEEANAISKASYMVGVLDERSQWYKKINEKIEFFCGFDKEMVFTRNVVMQELKELIGKEE